MAFTTPGTAVAGEVLTAAFWNEQVRDNTAAIRAAQVNVQSTVQTAAVTASVSTTFLDIAGMSVTITPTSLSSKVLVLANITNTTLVGFNVVHYRLVRNSTAISVGAAAGSRIASSIGFIDANSPTAGSGAVIHLDFPNTTSAVTYKIQWRVASGTNTVVFNRATDDADANSRGRYASNITAMEVPV